MTATQAALQDQQLRYSRSNEAEADRVGMRILYDAGMDPYAAPAMFERMLAASRYTSSSRIPEFLRTTPSLRNASPTPAIERFSIPSKSARLPSIIS